MRNSFLHLDFQARDRIEALWRSGHSQKEISEVLGVHKSTVSREIRNRKKENGTYSASVAEHKAGIKRCRSKFQGMKIEKYPYFKE
jgi:IS30 family transposase